MKKNINLALFFCLITFAVFNGCVKKAEIVTLEYWTLQLSPASENYIKSVIKKFEQTHPNIKIRVITIQKEGAAEKLTAAIKAGNQPDAVTLPAEFLARFTASNSFADLSKLITRDSLNFFLPNALQVCKIGEKVAGIPWYLSTHVLVYNKQSFNEAGYTEKDVPKTFKELVKFIKDYKTKTGKYALFCSIGKESCLPVLLESDGIEMTDKEMKKATFNSPEGIELITQWIDLYRKDFIAEETISKASSEAMGMYQAEKAAMIFDAPGDILNIKNNAPAIYENTDVSLSIVGKTGKHDMNVISLSVLSASKYQKEAAEFLMYITNTENELALCKLADVYPSVKDAFRDSYFVALDGTAEAKARVIGAIELPYADRLKRYYEIPQYEKLRDIFDEAITSACLGKMTTIEALDIAAAKWDEILQQNQK